MIVRAENIEKSFGERKVLRGITIEVGKGETVAVLGPSGSGKSTLLRCMDFLEKADRGTLFFDGTVHDLATIGKKEKREIRKRTGFVFQSYNLFSNMTALENVMEGLVTVHRVPKKEAEEKATATLRKVGMLDWKDHYPSELSGGQQQRVAIARAIVSDPLLVYFDEPTSALDPELTGEVLSVMKKLSADGMTMIVVTHEMAFAEKVASRVVFMEDGTVVEEGRSDEIFSSPREKRTAEFIKGIRAGGI